MQEITIQEAAMDATVERAEKALSKLRNGSGKVASCAAHADLAEGIVCVGEMMIPVYKHIAKETTDMPAIQTKFFSASGGKAMWPLATMVIALAVCYTLLNLVGGK